MSDRFSRTGLLFGEEAMKILANSRVAVFGVGGVGGYAVEALARSGIGAMDLIDDDKVCMTNINRQIIALDSTIGMYKVDAAAQRIHEINPGCKVTCHMMFYMPETADKLDFSQFDYVVDAIDTVTGKIEIIMQAKQAGIPVISSMGAGNKLDPTRFEVTDIYKTSVCPLAKVMRYQLKRRGVKKLKVVYSREEPITPQGEAADDGSEKTDMRTGSARRSTPGSVAFVPSVVGLIIAGEVIKDLTGINKKQKGIC
ncbi:MAG: tRNA threonylcarbamoyladenosine dehydratase [Ruminococcus sp.]|nr:tRNA threonylcarbamoyladenosine dehydratase [Ruminococcus sp.]